MGRFGAVLMAAALAAFAAQRFHRPAVGRAQAEATRLEAEVAVARSGIPDFRAMELARLKAEDAGNAAAAAAAKKGIDAAKDKIVELKKTDLERERAERRLGRERAVDRGLEAVSAALLLAGAALLIKSRM